MTGNRECNVRKVVEMETWKVWGLVEVKSQDQVYG